MKSALRLLMFALAVGGVVGGGAAWADSSLVKPFFGTYVGASLMPSVEMLPRDLRVSIRPAKADGFVIEWQTTLFKYGESQRRKSQLLEFRPTNNGPPMYEAAPSDSGSFAWAHVQGKVMRIHILTFLEDGGYVLQSYERTLTSRGMSLSFARIRDGAVEQRLAGELERIDG